MLFAIDDDGHPRSYVLLASEVADEGGGGGEVEGRWAKRYKNSVGALDGETCKLAGLILAVGDPGRAVDEDDVVVEVHETLEPPTNLPRRLYVKR
jgi:hypothetical protein